MNQIKQTEFGFQWGAAEIVRLFSDKKRGWVTIGIKTPKRELQVYVTKTGKIRIHERGNEWKPEKRKTNSRRARQGGVNEQA